MVLSRHDPLHSHSRSSAPTTKREFQLRRRRRVPLTRTIQPIRTIAIRFVVIVSVLAECSTAELGVCCSLIAEEL